MIEEWRKEYNQIRHLVLYAIDRPLLSDNASNYADGTNLESGIVYGGSSRVKEI